MTLRRSSPARSIHAPSRPKLLTPGRHTAGLEEGLRGIYPRDSWALFTEVRSETGSSPEVLRYADAIGVRVLAEAP